MRGRGAGQSAVGPRDTRAMIRAVLLLAFGLSAVQAATAPDAAVRISGFRGDTSGVFAGPPPPTAWDHASGTTVLWRADMPNISSATPAFAGDRVFVTSEPDWLLAFDARDGKELWRRQADVFAQAGEARKILDATCEQWRRRFITGDLDAKNKDFQKLPKGFARTHGIADWGSWSELQYSTASPVSDGEIVVAKFATGIIAAYTLDGGPLWAQRFPCDDLWSGATTPLMLGDLVVVVVPATEGKRVWQSLRALDRRSGRLVWESERFAPSGDLCGSPIATMVDGRPVIVHAGGAVVSPRDGKTLAKYIGVQGDGSSPTAVGDTVYFLEARARSNAPEWSENPNRAGGSWVYAVRLTWQGERLVHERLWETKFAGERTRTHGSPVCYQNRIYAFNKTHLRVFDATSGRVLHDDHRSKSGWDPEGGEKVKLGYFYASPCVAGGHLYLLAENGAMGVFRPGDRPELVGSGSALGKVVGSPMVGDGRIYIRTYRHLWCLGGK